MRRVKQIWERMRSITAMLWQQTIRLIRTFASLLKKAKSRQVHDLIMPLGVLIGTVSFGMWSQSFTGSLFAGTVLFFLASFYKTQQQLLTALRKSDGARQFGNVNSRTLRGPTQENSDAVHEAIKSLKPWLANEVSLTEENAKECCAVLVDSLAPRARAASVASTR